MHEIRNILPLPGLMRRKEPSSSLTVPATKAESGKASPGSRPMPTPHSSISLRFSPSHLHFVVLCLLDTKTVSKVANRFKKATFAPSSCRKEVQLKFSFGKSKFISYLCRALYGGRTRSSTRLTYVTRLTDPGQSLDRPRATTISRSH